MNDIDIDVFYGLFGSVELRNGELISDEQMLTYVKNTDTTKSSVELCLQKFGQLSLIKYDKIYNFRVEENGNLFCSCPEFGFTYSISNITIAFFDIVKQLMVFCE